MSARTLLPMPVRLRADRRLWSGPERLAVARSGVGLTVLRPTISPLQIQAARPAQEYAQVLLACGFPHMLPVHGSAKHLADGITLAYACHPAAGKAHSVENPSSGEPISCSSARLSPKAQ